MGKKINTLLFVIGGTAFNILITFICFFLFHFLYARFFQAILPETNRDWVMPLIFAASIFVSFLAYRTLIKIIVKKVDMNKYFDPIFGNRGGK